MSTEIALTKGWKQLSVQSSRKFTLTKVVGLQMLSACKLLLKSGARPAKKTNAHAGRPRKHEVVASAVGKQTRPRPFLVRSSAVLLTYHGIGESVWKEFIAFVQLQLSVWGVVHWCASMEKCVSGKPHVHLMLQFSAASDTRGVELFSFRGARPNASVTDVCGEGFSKKQFKRSVDRGMFLRLC